MSNVFHQLVRLSLTAGWMTLLLLLLRPLLKKAPRRFSCLLWALVGVRLALPFSLESRVSLVPQAIAAPPQVLPVSTLSPIAAPALTQTAAAQAAPAAPAAFPWQTVLSLLWVVGMGVMLLHALVSYIRLLKQVQVSIRLSKNIYLCDNISAPFVLGIAKPRIYLPSDMDGKLADDVLAHERSHLRRGDHIWKPLGYLLLSVYWFNPLCWLAYTMFCRDMEQACDESVIRNMDDSGRRRYSAALLTYSIPRSAVAACPLAFGEVSAKTRIRGVLQYRKPKFWVILVSLVLCVVLAVGLLTDPVAKAEAPSGTEDISAQTEEPIFDQYPARLNVLHEFLYASPLETTLYNSPSEADTVIATLEAETEVLVLRGGYIDGTLWLYVQYEDMTGWMKCGDEFFGGRHEGQDGASPAEEAENSGLPGTGVCPLFRGGTLYGSPSEASKVLMTLEAGASVTVKRRENIGPDQWAYVQYGDTLGWLKFDDDGDTAPADTTDTIIHQGPDGSTEYILPAGTAIYNSPSENSRVILTLDAETAVTALRVDNIGGKQWAYVQAGDRTGWTKCGGFLPDAQPAADAAEQGLPDYVLPQDATVYVAPSEASRSHATLQAGTTVSIWNLDSVGGCQWAYIQCGDTLGWIKYGGDEAQTVSYVGLLYTPSESISLLRAPTDNAATGATLEAGVTLQVIRQDTIGTEEWVYVQCYDPSVCGWLRVTGEGAAPLDSWGGPAYVLPEDAQLFDVAGSATPSGVVLRAGTTVQVRQLASCATDEEEYKMAFVQCADPEAFGWIRYDWATPGTSDRP